MEKVSEQELLERSVADGPYMLVSQMPVVKCCKCGSEMPAPGRMAYFNGQEVRYWCDCVTEDEMNEVAIELEALLRMHALPEEGPHVC